MLLLSPGSPSAVARSGTHSVLRSRRRWRATFPNILIQRTGRTVDVLSWLSLGILFFVVITLLYGIVAIHDIPYKIAKARNHPHQAAIHAGGWVSLLTLHAIWPFLWIWAYAYDPRFGYSGGQPAAPNRDDEMESLRRRLEDLESKVSAHQSADSQRRTSEAEST